MTIAQKMDVVDRIMDDLSRRSSEVPVIDWHGEMLRERATKAANGQEEFLSVEEAQNRIRSKTGRG